MAAGGGVLLALGGQAAASIAAGVRGTDVTAALLLLLPLTSLLVLQLVGRVVLENSWQCNDLAWLRWQVSLIGQHAAVLYNGKRLQGSEGGRARHSRTRDRNH
jgi:hypothetical protein